MVGASPLRLIQTKTICHLGMWSSYICTTTYQAWQHPPEQPNTAQIQHAAVDAISCPGTSETASNWIMPTIYFSAYTIIYTEWDT